jgi:hypothetical protein
MDLIGYMLIWTVNACRILVGRLTHIEDLAYFAYLVEQEMHAKF